MSELKYTDVMKPEDISVAHLWTHFAAMVVPLGASAGQREDMRRSFYAGFLECFKIVTDVSTELPEQRAAQVLERIDAEVKAFYEEMDGGKKLGR